MDREKLNSLLERVQTAMAPDRDLDAAICVAVGHGLPEAMGEVCANLRMPNQYDHVPLGHYWLSQRSGDSLRRAPAITTSVDAARAFVAATLPGWWVSSGICALSGHASLGPDYNGPDRDRLFREFPEDIFDAGFHADLEPGREPHREARAVMAAMLQALIAKEDV